MSEVLSRKRSLSVSMINKLHFKLGIPLESLVGSNKEENKSLKSKDIDVDLFPLKEIVDLGWLKKPIKSVEDALVGFLCPVRENYSEFLCRKSGTLSSEEKEQEYAIQAWVARILEISQKRSKSLSVYRDLSERWMNELVQLSSFDDGPKRALEELEKKGVLCVVEAAPKKSKVDGVSMFLSDGRPVIGLSLRFDRIDNYWYTLMHEIAHVKLHLGAEQSIIIDNIEKIDMSDSIESEADSMAQNVLIPREKWRACMARRTKDKNDVLNFANEIGIHPAIVAGRIRWESGNYSILSEMIGQNGVRSNF